MHEEQTYHESIVADYFPVQDFRLRNNDGLFTGSLPRVPCNRMMMFISAQFQLTSSIFLINKVIYG